jgi:hypothetical protein
MYKVALHPCHDPQTTTSALINREKVRRRCGYILTRGHIHLLGFWYVVTVGIQT